MPANMSTAAPVDFVSDEDPQFELYWPTYLSEDERQQLLALYDEVARHEATHGYAGSLANDVGRSIVDADAESLAKGRIHMLLARDCHRLVGSLVLEQCTSQSRKHTMNAKRAVIARRARGKLFHQAAAEAVNKAVALGVEVVTCDVAADGPVELWKSLGFKEHGVLPDYARRHGRSLDGYFLYLRLTSTTGSR
jgi:L-amino acid N-acyltransferase YncA